jgi:hypothetical protein
VDEDELARRRAERGQHPSTLPPLPDDVVEWSRPDPMLDVDNLPSVVRARLEALQGIAAEVADELERRGVDDLAERLREALP